MKTLAFSKCSVFTYLLFSLSKLGYSIKEITFIIGKTLTVAQDWYSATPLPFYTLHSPSKPEKRALKVLLFLSLAIHCIIWPYHFSASTDFSRAWPHHASRASLVLHHTLNVKGFVQPYLTLWWQPYLPLDVPDSTDYPSTQDPSMSLSVTHNTWGKCVESWFRFLH